MEHKKQSPVFLPLAFLYILGLYAFYVKYVPLVQGFQAALAPLLLLAVLLTFIRVEWGTLFFIFAFPLINGLPYFFGISEPTPHAPTALVLFLFYFLGWMLHQGWFRREPFPRDSIFKPIFLFAAIVVMSGAVTLFRYTNFYPFLSPSLFELTANVHGVTSGGAVMSVVFTVLNYLTGLAFFCILMASAPSRDFLNRMMMALCSSTLLSFLFGLYQHFYNIKLGNSPLSVFLALINGTFKDALSFGGYIAIVTPLLLGVCLAFRGRLRVFSFLMLPLSVYLSFYTGSKSGFLCLSLSSLVFILLSSKVIFSLLKSKSVSLKKIRLSSWIVVLLILAILTGLIAFKDYFAKDIKSSMTLTRLKSFQIPLKYRINNLWKLAVPMMKDYPLTGVGIGGYIVEVSNYSKINKIDIEPESAENYILQVGSEMGLIGIVLVLWILWEIIKQMRGSWLRIPSNDNYKFVLIGSMAGVFAFLMLVQAHTFVGSYEIKYTFWLLVGIIFSLGRPVEEKGEGLKEKPIFNKSQKTASLILISLFSVVHLWNSTHMLSLKSRTEQLGLKQDFGLYPLEKTNDGLEFRWTRSHGGFTIKIEKRTIVIPLLASHPDIKENSVSVKISLVKDFFKEKILLGEITLNESAWRTYEFSIPKEEVGQEDILLLQVNRTWNPLQATGAPDPRDLGVAIGKISFRD